MLTRLLPRRRTPPRLSVVVPVYNVETYLADCLDSLLAQRFRDYEVVLVDDGSTDGSAAIAERYSRKHRHMQLVSTDNRGLGAARNTGLRHTTCEYVAFLDSDDLVPPDAYQAMVDMLDETGSDFAVGSVEQIVGDESVVPPWIARLHVELRRCITIDDWPPVMANVYAWSKMFRRSFWDRLGLAFPEGVRYEDQVTMTEAYLRAEAFDVLRRPVYKWRIRHDGSSITQRRHELADLQDRITTKALTTDIVAAYGSPDIQDFWARNGLPGDLPVYFREILGCDDAYWQLLHEGVRELFAGRPPIEESRLRVSQRLVGWLVVHGRRADAEHVLGWLDDHPGALSLRVRGDHVVAQLPFSDDRHHSGIPERAFWLGDHELELDSRLTKVGWSGSTLRLTGMALIRGAPTQGVSTRLGVALRGDAGIVLAMHVEQRLSAEATEWVGRGDQNYDRSGFEAHLDLTDLVTRLAEERSNRDWTVQVDVEVEQIVRSGPLRSKVPELELPPGTVDGRMVQVDFRRGQGLILHVV